MPSSFLILASSRRRHGRYASGPLLTGEDVKAAADGISRLAAAPGHAVKEAIAEGDRKQEADHIRSLWQGYHHGTKDVCSECERALKELGRL